MRRSQINSPKRRVSQRAQTPPTRVSVRARVSVTAARDFDGHDADDHRGDSLVMGSRLRDTSIPGLENIRVSETGSRSMSRVCSDSRPKLVSARNMSILEEIKDAQTKLAQQLTQEANALKVLMEALSRDICKLRRERTEIWSTLESKSPTFAPSALRVKASPENATILTRRSQNSQVAALNGVKKMRSSAASDGDNSPLLESVRTSRSNMRCRLSEDVSVLVLSDQVVADLPKLEVPHEVKAQVPCFKVNPVFEKVVMNGVSELREMPACGQDEPLVWSTVDFQAFDGMTEQIADPRSLSDDAKLTNGTGQADFLESTSQQATTISRTTTNGSQMHMNSNRSLKSNIASNFSRNKNGLNTIATASKVSGVDLGEASTNVRPAPSVIFNDRGSGSRCIMFPDSPRRNVWDICSFVVLLFDCITIPYNIAWRPSESAFVTVGTWATMLFWTVDMGLSFNTAHYVEGELETRRLQIVKHYLKSSFIFDAVATGCDWLMAMLQFMPDSMLGGSSEASFASILRFVKAQRALRVARFLRVSSMWSRLEQLHMCFLSDAWQMVTQVVTMLFGLFLVNHLICCFWYAIGGQASSDTGLSWLDITESVDGVPIPYLDFNPYYQYFTSYHWSVVQMFVGSTQVNAMNTSERIFNIFCNLFGTFFTAGITSWFSALLVGYQNRQSHFETVMKSIRRYLRLNKVSPSLSARVQKQLSIRLSTRKRDTEADIEAFQLLSKALRAEVRLAVAWDALFASPMIMLFNKFDHSITLAICTNFEYLELRHGDHLFEANFPLGEAFAVIRGPLVYVYMGAEEGGLGPLDRKSEMSRGISGNTNANAALAEYEGTKVDDGTWIAEAVLWVQDWQTCGFLEAMGDTELISLKRDSFINACGRQGKIQALIKAYTKAYEDLLRNQRECELSDIETPVEHSIVVMSMPTKDRMVAAEPVLVELRSRLAGVGLWKSRPTKGAEALEEEVRAGECGLILDENGDPSRIAFVVLLRAEREDGLVLIQVAKFNDGHCTPKLQMPATKMKDGERVTEAAQRVLRKNLHQFGGAQEMGRHTQDNITKSTPNYGMDTRFCRTYVTVPFLKSSITPPVVHYIDYQSKATSYRKMHSLSRSMSRASKLESSGLRDLMPEEFYFVRSGPTSGTIYAWMTDMTFGMLSEPEHDKFLEEYVDHISVPANLGELDSPRLSSLT